MEIGALGDIAFEFSEDFSNSIDELRRQRTWKYAEHEIVSGKSKLQSLGRQLDVIAFSGRFLDSFCVPLTEITRLADAADNEEPLPFAVGDEAFGDFVVESITETWKEVDGDGNPRVIEFDIALKEYN